jgi:hypothetical protein
MKMKVNIYTKLIVFATLLFSIHYLTVYYLLPNYFVEGIYKMHLFLVITTLIILFLIAKITKVDATNFGKGFIVSVVLKMLSTIIFLWPIINSTASNRKIYIVHFFIVFFIYLITEVKLLISIIKK